MTSLAKFIAGLRRLVDATKEKEHPTIKDSAAAIAEYDALVKVAEAAYAAAHFKTADPLKALRSSLAELEAARKL